MKSKVIKNEDKEKIDYYQLQQERKKYNEKDIKNAPINENDTNNESIIKKENIQVELHGPVIDVVDLINGIGNRRIKKRDGE